MEHSTLIALTEAQLGLLDEALGYADDYLDHLIAIEGCPAIRQEFEHEKRGVSELFDLLRRAANDDSPWSDDDAAAASQEGWNLFVAEGSDLAPRFWDIEREDEQEPPAFSDDREALKFVINQASQGSALHRRALALYMTLAK